MTTVKFIFLLICFFATDSLLVAGNGSIYSRFGVGEIITYAGSRTAAMGGTGIALLSDNYVNSENPATLGLLSRVQYAGDFQYQGYDVSDGTHSTFLSSGNIQSAMLAMPVYNPYNITLAFGITPFSRTAYAVRDPELQAAQNIVQIYDGSGGLSSAQASASFSPARDLYLGATAHYLFGNFDLRQQLEYPDAGFFASDAERVVSMNGFAYTFGAAVSGIDKVLGLSTEKHVNFAATVFTGSSLNASEQTIQNFTTSKETTDVFAGNAKIPLGIALGFEYQPRERLILTADLRFGQWSQYSYLGVHPQELRNSTRFGIGGEFSPATTFGDAYYKQVVYRAGGYVNATNIVLNGEAINEYFVTGGIGVPIFSSMGSEGRLNISLEYGIRGTTSNGLQRDKITRLTISLNGSDTWFVPPEVE